MAYLIHFYVKFYTSGLPPGPTPLPVIGNLHQLAGMVHKKVNALGNKYGDVWTLYMGPEPLIILHNYAVFKDTFVNNVYTFSGRGYWRVGVDASTKDGVVRGMIINCL